SSHLLQVLVRTSRRARARIALVPAGTAGLVAPHRRPRTRLLTLPEHGVAPSADPLPVVQPPTERIGAMQLTSGTTGFPRICVWKHRGILAALDGMRQEALKTNFGCAENAGGATFSAPDGMYVHELVDRALLHQKGVARPVTSGEESGAVPVVGVGRPAPGIRVAVFSSAGRRLPDGHVGELALDTPSRMVGYLRQRRETRRARYRGWLG